MEINYIRHFTYKCSLCSTSIKFDIPSPLDTSAESKLEEISTAVGKLICPKCNQALNIGATKSLDAVKRYNAAVAQFKLFPDFIELD